MWSSSSTPCSRNSAKAGNRRPPGKGAIPAVLSLAVFAVLGLLVAYPCLEALWESARPGGQWSGAVYAKIFADPYYLRLMGRSVAVSVAGSLAAALLGTMLAVAVFKTRCRLRPLFAACAVLPMVIPGFVSSIAYIFLFGRNGLVTYRWLGISWDVYSWKSVLVIQSVDQTTAAFFLAAVGLAALDRRLEDAARNLGAGEWRVLGTVTLPLALPMVGAGLLLNFMRAMADFGTPMVVGGRYETLASASYGELIGRYDMPMAAGLNAVLVLFCLAAYWGYLRFEAKAGNMRLEDSGGGGSKLRLGGAGGAVCWAVCLAFSLFVCALMAAVVLAAFAEFTGSGIELTLDHLRAVWDRGIRSSLNTLGFALMVGMLVAVGGLGLAYLFKRVRIPGARVLDWLATVPFALPGTFFGVGYAIAFNKPPLLLAGTWTIVVLNLVMRRVPLGLRAGASLLDRQDPRVEEASLVLGASRPGTFVRVIMPMGAGAMVVGGLYAFVSAVQTLGSIIFLITPGTKLLSVDVFEAVVRGEVGIAAAHSLVMLALGGSACLAIFALGRKGRGAAAKPDGLAGMR